MAILALLLVAAAAPVAQDDFVVQGVAPTFQLSEARGSMVALHFLLKTECPYCLKYTHEYASRASETPGVIHVFLKPDEPAEIQKWMTRLEGSRPTIYCDAGGKVAERYKIPGGYKFHGQVTHYPALVLLDREGTEVFRYVGKSNADRCPFDQFKAKVEEFSPAKETK